MKHQRASSTRTRGITLVELLIALAVVAILSVIAWPGYGTVRQRAHRNDARLALLRIQHLQESHYATHLRYAAHLGRSTGAETLVAPERSDAGHYLLSVSAGLDGQSFTAFARARPGGRQSGDRACQQLSIDETGRRRSADASDRWIEADPRHCWG